MPCPLFMLCLWQAPNQQISFEPQVFIISLYIINVIIVTQIAMLQLIKITVANKSRAFIMCTARTRSSHPNMACTHPMDIR